MAAVGLRRTGLMKCRHHSFVAFPSTRIPQLESRVEIGNRGLFPHDQDDRDGITLLQEGHLVSERRMNGGDLGFGRGNGTAKSDDGL